MRVRVFTLRYDELVGGFDESALQAFIVYRAWVSFF